MFVQTENRRAGLALVATKTFERRQPIMKGMGQDMDVRVRPVDERSVHPNLAMRFKHASRVGTVDDEIDGADYSSGPEEASSKRAGLTRQD